MSRRSARAVTGPVPVPEPVLALTADLLRGMEPGRGSLLAALHRIQDRWGVLPEPCLRATARLLGLAPVEVHELACFYHGFEVVPEIPDEPLRRIRVCDSLPCRLAGSATLFRSLEATLPPEARLDRVSCLGLCDQAPAALVDGGPRAPADTGNLLEPAPPGGEPAYRDLQGYREAGGYRVLAAVHAGRLSATRILEALETAGLRGLGGAGFPTAVKWRAVMDAPAPKHVVVNIDESEPGTFKDRRCIETDPHQALEGALVAARVVGAEHVHLYLRDEYTVARGILERELEMLRSLDLTLPELRLHRGAGSYICGEESALLESIEGRRPLPHLRPPYVAERGLWGRPTLVQNLETLHRVTEVLRHGPQRFAASGREGFPGRRFYCLSGRVARPGVYEAPNGITLRELIDEHAGGMAPGHRLGAFLPGGASGGILPASMEDRPLAFGTLEPEGAFLGSAAIIVLSEQDDPRAAAAWCLSFLARESCGKCTPCREGTIRAARLMTEPGSYPCLLERLAEVMAEGSICGLGQSAANPIRTLFRHFPNV